MNSDSPLISETILLPSSNFSAKASKTVRKITPHHAAGVNATFRGMVNTWRGKSVSANYGIQSDGKICLFVHEKDRAYTSSNSNNDSQAVTVEIANCKGAPNWEVSDAAVKSFILLCVDICKRNGMPGLNWTGNSKGTLTVHQMFKATACPGPYLMKLMPWIAKEVTERVAGKTGDIIIPKIPGMNPGAQNPKNPVTSTAAATVSKKYIYSGLDMSLVFNPDYYYNRYPDLQKAIGKNNDKLFNHFCKYGMSEGRQAISTFNPVIYRKRYSDLEKVYGNNLIKYYQHYVIFGAKEKRIGY